MDGKTPPTQRVSGGIKSAAQTETLNQRTVTLNVDRLQVLQKALAATNEEKQTTTGVVIVLVILEVLGEVVDAMRQKRNLHLGRAGVTLAQTVFLNDLLLDGGIVSHWLSYHLVARRTGACSPEHLESVAD